MKSTAINLVLISLCFLVPSPTFGQIFYGNTEGLIEKTLRSGGYDGHLTKQLRTLGDEAAVSIARVVSDASLTRPEVDMILTLLQDSFSDVSQIQLASNRQPRVAFLLLRYLEYSVQDSALRIRISEARKALTKVSSQPAAK